MLHSYTKKSVPGCLSPHPCGKGIRVRWTGVLRGSDLLIFAGFFDGFRMFAFYSSFCHKLCMPLKKLALSGFGPALEFLCLFSVWLVLKSDFDVAFANFLPRAIPKKNPPSLFSFDYILPNLNMPAPQARPASAEFLPMPDLPQFTQPEDSAQVVQSS